MSSRSLARPPAELARRFGALQPREAHESADHFTARNNQLLVKVLRPHAAVPPAELERVLRDLERLSATHHPSLPTLEGFGRDGGALWYARAWFEGRSLAQRLAESGPLQPAEAALASLLVCSALAMLHRSGLVHRDLRPGHALVTPDGRVLLLDSCAPRFVSHRGRWLGGDPAYAPPEAFAGQQLTAQSDLFSLGALFYEALTGKPPVGPRGEPWGLAPVGTRLAGLPANLPRNLGVVLQKLLEHEPNKRHQSAQYAERDLASLSRGATLAYEDEGANAGEATAESTTVMSALEGGGMGDDTNADLVAALPAMQPAPANKPAPRPSTPPPASKPAPAAAARPASSLPANKPAASKPEPARGSLRPPPASAPAQEPPRTSQRPPPASKPAQEPPRASYRPPPASAPVNRRTSEASAPAPSYRPPPAAAPLPDPASILPPSATTAALPAQKSPAPEPAKPDTTASRSKAVAAPVVNTSAPMPEAWLQQNKSAFSLFSSMPVAVAPGTPKPQNSLFWRYEAEDEEAGRKIRRSMSPAGRAIVALVCAAVLGMGLGIYQSERSRALQARSIELGRTELEQLLARSLPAHEQAAQLRAIHQRFRNVAEIRMAALRGLAELRDPLAVPLFREGLAGSVDERRQCALALAALGQPAADAAREALLQALPQSNPRVDRPELVWALVALQDARVWPEVVPLLRDSTLQNLRDLSTPPRALFDVSLLARLAGVTRLQELARDTAVPLRQVAAQGLSELGGAASFDALEALTRDASPLVARDAAIGVARTGDARAGGAVQAFLASHANLEESFLDGLAEQAGSQGLGVLAAVATSQTALREGLARRLRNLRDPGAAGPLRGLLALSPAGAETNEARRQAVLGLGALGDPGAAQGLLEVASGTLTPSAAELARGTNPAEESRLALVYLAELPGGPGVVKAGLLALLADASKSHLRPWVLRALAATGDASVASAILPLLSNGELYVDAGGALCRLNHAAGIARLWTDARRPSGVRMSEPSPRTDGIYRHRLAALQALQALPEGTAVTDLLAMMEDRDDDVRLRSAAAQTVGFLGDAAAIDRVAARFLDTNQPEDLRAVYGEALRFRLPTRLAGDAVAMAMRPGVNPLLMRATALAAGYNGDENTAQLLRARLNQNDAQLKALCLASLVLLGETGLAGTILEALPPRNPLVERLQPWFVPAAGEAAEGALSVEQVDLRGLTAAMFEDGRIYRRVALAAALRRGNGTTRAEFVQEWLFGRMQAGWAHPRGLSPAAIRERLRRAAQGADAGRREQALAALRGLADRGSLLWLRAQPGSAAEQARQELVRLRNGG